MGNNNEQRKVAESQLEELKKSHPDMLFNYTLLFLKSSDDTNIRTLCAVLLRRNLRKSSV